MTDLVVRLKNGSGFGERTIIVNSELWHRLLKRTDVWFVLTGLINNTFLLKNE